jgi:hypothetical protein
LKQTLVILLQQQAHQGAKCPYLGDIIIEQQSIGISLIVNGMDQNGQKNIDFDLKVHEYYVNDQ